jgi:hypothetical protein
MLTVEHSYSLCLRGKNHLGNEYSITLGPWTKKSEADAYSDSLTDTRIGEQLLKKLGVEELIVFES